MILHYPHGPRKQRTVWLVTEEGLRSRVTGLVALRFRAHLQGPERGPRG